MAASTVATQASDWSRYLTSCFEKEGAAGVLQAALHLKRYLLSDSAALFPPGSNSSLLQASSSSSSSSSPSFASYLVASSSANISASAPVHSTAATIAMRDRLNLFYRAQLATAAASSYLQSSSASASATVSASSSSSSLRHLNNLNHIQQQQQIEKQQLLLVSNKDRADIVLRGSDVEEGVQRFRGLDDDDAEEEE